MSNDSEGQAGRLNEDDGQVTRSHTRAPAKAQTYAMSSMRTSREGLAFITSVEGSGSDTDRLQWPGGGSDVTVGLGYDLHAHNPREIVSDLTSIGIDRNKAEFLASKHGLVGPDAGDFINKNKNLIILTSSQKQALLQKVIGKYEKKVKEEGNFAITQYQFDALVALAYNPGGPLSVITRSIAAGNFVQAEKDWLSRSYSSKIYSRVFIIVVNVK